MATLARFFVSGKPWLQGGQTIPSRVNQNPIKDGIVESHPSQRTKGREAWGTRRLSFARRTTAVEDGDGVVGDSALHCRRELRRLKGDATTPPSDLGLSWMPATPSAPACLRLCACSSHYSRFCAMGLLHGRKVPRHSLLARMGHLADQARQIRGVRPFRAQSI